MKGILTLMIFSFGQLFEQAQTKTKQVLIQGSGQPIVFLHGDTFDIRSHPMWPKWLKQKDQPKRLSVVSAYKIDFKKLHAFQNIH